MAASQEQERASDAFRSVPLMSMSILVWLISWFVFSYLSHTLLGKDLEASAYIGMLCGFVVFVVTATAGIWLCCACNHIVDERAKRR